jgi:hypothetical protein
MDEAFHGLDECGGLPEERVIGEERTALLDLESRGARGAEPRDPARVGSEGAEGVLSFAAAWGACVAVIAAFGACSALGLEGSHEGAVSAGDFRVQIRGEGA